ncbi:hypothetical protein B0T24DRAFT_575243 [Lasiosphaeria ovina]|uniref:Beta-cyclopiazonate dehydrogenase n=1 Tax=Lasiosphaeria ovina TaxID=92902 RepID=A0AAE0KA74_9PEZI|nr:hypothetical protein B0T24DRAFT_575243 [Lasiosphaeria ovina]
MAISQPWTWSSSRSTLVHFALLTVAASAGPHPFHIGLRDVVILGGGASGTYAAVRLREDYGKSVLLVEQEAVLGGHTNTFIIPETGDAINYGVQSYIDYMGAKAFFERFNVPLQGDVLFASNTLLVDPSTGAIDTNPPAQPPLNESLAALQKYHDIIKPFDAIQLPGYWDFPSGDDIPADLLLPFNEFIAKYDLQAIAPILTEVSGQSITLPDPTLFVIKNFGTPVVEGFLEQTLFDPVPFDNSLLYAAAGDLLGADVLLSSTVLQATRTGAGVELVVQNLQTGEQSLVVAKRLLVAAPPSTANLGALGLDAQETAVFDTWSFLTVYTATLKTNLVPDNTSIAFSGLINSTSSFSVTWNNVPGFFWVIFFSVSPLSSEAAADIIVDEMAALHAAGTFAPVDGSSVVVNEVVAISNHSQVVWGQSFEQIQAGFVQDLYALQGHRSTWYTGGLWCPDFSSNVWAFTDTVLPRLLRGI